MTTEIERTFFDTFEIKPKSVKRTLKLAMQGYDESDLPEDLKQFISSQAQVYNVYPQITDHILLELICLLADLYDSNSYGYPLLSKDINELKEDVLDDLMGAIDVENDYPEGYANKVRTPFAQD